MPDPRPTILLVEDDPIIRDLVVLAIKRLDLQVITACDGQEAAALFKTERPDLVLLDILLPYVSGLDVLQLIKQDQDIELSQVPVIIISALGYREVVQMAMSMGASDFILKPFYGDELISRVINALNCRGFSVQSSKS